MDNRADNEIFLSIPQTVSTFARFFGATIETGIKELLRLGDSHEMMRLWAKKSLDILGVELTIKGIENVKLDDPQVFCANHQGNVDILIMNISVPVKFYWVYKHTLNYAPIIGTYLLRNGHIPVNRSNREKAHASIRRAGERIRAGQNIVLFPEGTRSGGPELLPFKKGAFWLAKECGVPVVPVTIDNSWKLMKKNSLKLRRCPVTVTFHPPVDPTGLEVDELLEKVRESIMKGLQI